MLIQQYRNLPPWMQRCATRTRVIVILIFTYLQVYEQGSSHFVARWLAISFSVASVSTPKSLSTETTKVVRCRLCFSQAQGYFFFLAFSAVSRTFLGDLDLQVVASVLTTIVSLILYVPCVQRSMISRSTFSSTKSFEGGPLILYFPLCMARHVYILGSSCTCVWGKGLTCKVGDPIIKLDVTCHDEAYLLSVEGLSDIKCCATPITIFWQEMGINAIVQEE